MQIKSDKNSAIKIAKNGISENVRSKTGNRIIALGLVMSLLMGNLSFETNAINKAQKVGKSSSAVAKSKSKKANSKNRKPEADKSSESAEDRIAKLEKKLGELEERVAKLEGENKQSPEKTDEKSKKDVNSDWAWPVPGYHKISSKFSKKHRAIDISGDGKNGSIYGAKVVAANSGTVKTACQNSGKDGYGNYVVIDHGDGKSTLYGHLSSVSVKENQKVSKGQEIGKAGSTGFSTGPHLHFEYRINDVRTNPSKILKYNS